MKFFMAHDSSQSLIKMKTFLQKLVQKIKGFIAISDTFKKTFNNL